jgi:hypothetical protein
MVREINPLPGAMTLSVRRADELRSLREAADKAISGRQSDASWICESVLIGLVSHLR